LPCLAQTDAEHYARWLRQDVLYIISPEERDVFKKLTNDAERDAFIEQFWKRREYGSRLDACETRALPGPALSARRDDRHDCLGAKAAVSAIRSLQREAVTVRSLQEYHSKAALTIRD